MGIVHLAFDGVAWIGAFLIVHLFTSSLLRDRTNIDFSTSILVVLIPSFILYYGIPAHGIELSVRVFTVISVAILLAWILANFLTVLTWWEDLLIGIVAVGSYLLLYTGAQWVWTKTFLE